MPGVGSGSPTAITPLQSGAILCAASDGVAGNELWQSDGTDRGTTLFQDIAVGPGSSSPSRLRGVGSRIFFAADDNAHGEELWTLGDTVANTAPTASQAILTTHINRPIGGALPASDQDDDTLTFSIVANARSGIVTITNARTGAFTYAPEAGMIGIDNFTFKVNDGLADSNIATVQISIRDYDLYLPLTSR
jgi:ELWxxDGT repeat protein